MLVVIHGNIGAGKTSAVTKLAASPLGGSKDAPTIYNVAYRQLLFHDGRENRLEQQIWGPLLSANEMGNPSVGYVLEKIGDLPDYDGRFEAAFDGRGVTMETLGLDYLDLFLMHWPLPTVGDYVETWRAMEEMHASGRVRSIGVSNFKEHHLQRLLDETETVPAVNQIEVHPYLTQDDLRGFNTSHGIITEAWSPIATGVVLNDPMIMEIAECAGRSAAQDCLIHPGTNRGPANRRQGARVFDE